MNTSGAGGSSAVVKRMSPTIPTTSAPPAPARALREELADETAAARADGHAHRHLAAPRFSARELQVRQVRREFETPIRPLPSVSASSLRRPSPPLPLLSPGERRG